MAPAARGGDVLLSRDGIGLAEESRDAFAVLELQRADAERRWNLGDERSKARMRHLPHFDFDAIPVPVVDEPGPSVAKVVQRSLRSRFP